MAGAERQANAFASDRPPARMHRHGLLYGSLRALFVLVLAAYPAWLPAAPAAITALTVEGAIGPAGADYVSRGLARAAADGSQMAILKLDTPGGLDSSMRVIIKAILSSPIPVASYVAPSGARAASAGTYILYASHIAVMAPGTNLGAATPVQIGGPPVPLGTPEKEPAEQAQQPKQVRPEESKAPLPRTTSVMTEKQVNDAAAYLRGLAQLRGRNAEWAEQAVRQAVSLSATEALKMNVIDYVAADIGSLLSQLDGRRVKVQQREILLQTGGAQLRDYLPDWRVRLLAVITDPSVALILMMIGIYGLIFEFTSPGFGLPGVLGAICLLVGLYALQLLPVNYAGMALILLGIAFMIAEAFAPSFGLLGLGGIVAFMAGALILIDTELPAFGIPIGLIVASAVLSALLIAGITGMALKARRLPLVSGEAQLVGRIAEVVDVRDDAPTEGWVSIRGENWRVLSRTPLRRAQKVRVLARDGLALTVAPQDIDEHGEQS
jgi:membrane-bound serine protease (ClpP class)